MKITLTYLANAGYYLSYSGGGIAVDSVFTDGDLFFSTPGETILQDLLSRTGRFEALNLYLFTHCHKDHCDLRLVGAMLKNAVPVMLPDDPLVSKIVSEADRENPSLMRLDEAPFQWEREGVRLTGFRTPHDRAPEGIHECYLLEFLEEHCNVLILGDTETGEAYFPTWLKDKRIDAVSVNFTELNQEKGRTFLREVVGAETIVLCHMPFAEDDHRHTRKYTIRQMERFQEMFPGLWLPQQRNETIVLGSK